MVGTAAHVFLALLTQRVTLLRGRHSCGCATCDCSLTSCTIVYLLPSTNLTIAYLLLSANLTIVYLLPSANLTIVYLLLSANLTIAYLLPSANLTIVYLLLSADLTIVYLLPCVNLTTVSTFNRTIVQFFELYKAIICISRKLFVYQLSIIGMFVNITCVFAYSNPEKILSLFTVH